MAATSSSSVPGLRLCDKGCGRPAFKSFPSCCVKCTGDSEAGHNRDCAAKAEVTRKEAAEAADAAGAAVAARLEKKRARDDDERTCPAGVCPPPPSAYPCGCIWSDAVTLVDGLTFSWQAHVSAESKKYHGSTLTCRFTAIMNASFDWERAPGYLYVGQRAAGDWSRASALVGAPVLVLKVSAGFEWRGGWSQRSNNYSWGFKQTDPSAVPDPKMGPLVVLDAAGTLEAEKAFAFKDNIPRAYCAFLDACAKALDVSVTDTDVSNKATYVHLKVTTPGGSVFVVDARMGGTFMSERRILENARRNASKFLKDLHALGQANSMSAGTYANVSLENTGTDLSIDHEGFELRLTDEHKAKVGTASKGASRYADESE